MPGLSVRILQGIKYIATGAPLEDLRGDRTGALVTTDGHARFMEAAVNGTLFSGGMTLTAITNATFTTATLGATATPIIGLWNPLTSGKNAIIIYAKLQAILTALQETGAGAYMWCTSTGNGGISTGNTPFNTSTFLAAGSIMKDMSGVALTGLTNNLVVRTASGLQGGANSNLSTLQTASGLAAPAYAAVDLINGTFVVPPGGVLALLCTTTPVAISAASSILWEEVPV